MNIKYKITCLIFVPFSVWKNLVSEREREAVFQTVGAELEEADGEGHGVGGAEVCGPGQQALTASAWLGTFPIYFCFISSSRNFIVFYFELDFHLENKLVVKFLL